MLFNKDFYNKYKCDFVLWTLLALVILYYFFPKLIEHFEPSNADSNNYMTVTPNSTPRMTAPNSTPRTGGPAMNQAAGNRIPNSTPSVNTRPQQSQRLQPELQKQMQAQQQAQQQQLNAGNFACDSGNFISANLLPKISSELNDEAFEFAPKDLTNINFLEATDTIGVDTVSSSLRNASYDIRSTPTNPRDVVSPWMNSTIDPELTRRPLE